jgi:hypothetical protein
MTESKESREIVAELRRQSWRVERTDRGHYKAYPPGNKPMVTFAGGLSGDPRSIKNAVAQLRKSGFQWPPPKQNGNTWANSYDAPCAACGKTPSVVIDEQRNAFCSEACGRSFRDGLSKSKLEAFTVGPEGRLTDGTVIKEGDTIFANGVIRRTPTPDELYAELRAARDDHRLHAELLAEAEATCAKAERELADARDALQAAGKRLKEAKASFDAEFEAEGT